MSPALATSTVSSILLRCQLGAYLKAIDKPSRSALAPKDGSRPLSIDTRSGASNLVALSISFVLMPSMISATSALSVEAIADVDSFGAAAAKAGKDDSAAAITIER